MQRFMMVAFVVTFLCLPFAAGSDGNGEDYRAYIRTSKDFKRVNQSRELLMSGRWTEWVYMPWRYRWGRKYTADLAVQMKKAGFNGGYCDHKPDSDAEFHEKQGFPWYLDHFTGKGELKLRSKHNKKANRKELNRPVCLIAPETMKKMKDFMSDRGKRCLKYKMRVAYALGDELSWSVFTSPSKWDNNPLSRADFARWLQERYGSEATLKKQWTENVPEAMAGLVNWGAWKNGGEPPKDYIKRMTNPDDFQFIYKRPMDTWNLSSFCDALSYMDSQFNNVIGDLVEHSNRIDPETPCGFVGAHCPAAYSGSDYAKTMRKVQFLEAYDIGGSMEIGRSFSAGNKVPLVRTGFGNPSKHTTAWFYWHYMVHGDRGIIQWAENWFRDDGGKTGTKPNISTKDVMATGPIVKKIAEHSRPLYEAKWVHDGVALYYSHPSIQMSWVIDCERHGKTWISRSSSLNNAFNSSVGQTWAWQKLLEDFRVQYNWISYADLLEKGIDPNEYKVLILPRTLALSDQEADVIRKYVEAGGHLIADHQTGLFDQHGKARAGGKGALDDLFGIEKRPVCRKGSMFYGKTLCEIDVENCYTKTKSFVDGGALIWSKCLRDKHGLIKAQRDMDTFQSKESGKGWAAHLNVSVMEYTHVRTTNYDKCAAYITPVTDLLLKAGVKPWVRLSVDGRNPHISEATYWEKDGRVVVCVVKNPIKFASIFGETKTEGVTDKTVQLTVEFDRPKKDVTNVSTGKTSGDASKITLPWKLCESAMVSFKK